MRSTEVHSKVAHSRQSRRPSSVTSGATFPQRGKKSKRIRAELVYWTEPNVTKWELERINVRIENADYMLRFGRNPDTTDCEHRTDGKIIFKV